MQCRIKWVEGRTFVAESGSGHALVLDGPTERGGRNLGPSPMELVLLGTGGCTAFDVLDILKKVATPSRTARWSWRASVRPSRLGCSRGSPCVSSSPGTG
jgi:uncharacterized OsmC-like protein